MYSGNLSSVRLVIISTEKQQTNANPQNLSDTIVNGSVGKITGFKTITEALLSPEIIEYLPSSDPDWRPGDPPPPLKIPLEKLSKKQKFPMVQYENGEHMLVVPFRFRHINVEGKEEASRTQV